MEKYTKPLLPSEGTLEAFGKPVWNNHYFFCKLCEISVTFKIRTQHEIFHSLCVFFQFCSVMLPAFLSLLYTCLISCNKKEAKLGSVYTAIIFPLCSRSSCQKIVFILSHYHHLALWYNCTWQILFTESQLRKRDERSLQGNISPQSISISLIKPVVI